MHHPRNAALLAVVSLSSHRQAGAFIEEIFQQAFGGQGGGGGFQFQMGGDDIFEQLGGGGRRQQRREIKWPKGTSDKITKNFNFLKGTEWNWNNWRNVKFSKDGNFDAPTRDCQSGQCKWSANKGKVWILWGEAGLHELEIRGQMPKDSADPKALQGLTMAGRRVNDGERCSAVFQRVYDHEAAALQKDLYDILGLQDDADEAEIKKVYRKLSIKYHPDKNPDEASRLMFNEVRDAYEILNDPEKKILYDTGGMEAVKKMEKGEIQRGEDINMEAAVTLESIYNGEDSVFHVSRRVVCRGCRVKPDSPKCKGCGRCPNEIRMVNRQVAPGMFMQQQEEVQSKEKCKHENTPVTLSIEKGVGNGEIVPFPRMAEQTPGHIPGNVLVKIKTNKHKKFERRGKDLHMSMSVTLREALLGWKQTIRHLDGHVVEISTDSVTQPFQIFQIKGEGMPLKDDPASFGDLYVKVEVVFPKQLTDNQFEKVEEVFPPPPPRPEL